MKLLTWVSQIWMNRWAKAVFWMAMAAAVTFGLVESLFPTRIPPELRGQWVVAEGDLKGDMLEIFSDGAMIARKNKAGHRSAPPRPLTAQSQRDQTDEPMIIRGTIRVQGNTLRITAVNPVTGNEVTDSQTILEWTEDQLVVEDEHRELLIMKRQR